MRAPSRALTTVESPAPATVAGGANARHRRYARSRRRARRRAPRTGHGAAPRIQIRPGAAPVPPGRRPAPPLRRPTGSLTRVAWSLGLLAARHVGVVVALLILTSRRQARTRRRHAAHTRRRLRPRRATSAKPKPAAFNRHRSRSTVLNGTATTSSPTGCAEAGRRGYKQGTVATAADQTAPRQSSPTCRATSATRSPSPRRSSLGPASVQPIDASTQAVACPRARPVLGRSWSPSALTSRTSSSPTRDDGSARPPATERQASRSRGSRTCSTAACRLSRSTGMVEVAGEFVDLVKLGWGTALGDRESRGQARALPRARAPGRARRHADRAGDRPGPARAARRLAARARPRAHRDLRWDDHARARAQARADRALRQEFVVLSEVGSKDDTRIMAPYRWVELIQEELEAGPGR